MRNETGKKQVILTTLHLNLPLLISAPSLFTLRSRAGMCPHFSSCLLASLSASPLFILPFSVVMFPSIHFDFVLLLTSPLYILPVSAIWLPTVLAFQCCCLHPHCSSYPPVLITVLPKHGTCHVATASDT